MISKERLVKIFVYLLLHLYDIERPHESKTQHIKDCLLSYLVVVSVHFTYLFPAYKGLDCRSIKELFLIIIHIYFSAFQLWKLSKCIFILFLLLMFLLLILFFTNGKSTFLCVFFPMLYCEASFLNKCLTVQRRKN